MMYETCCVVIATITHDKYYPFFRKDKLLYEANACVRYQTHFLHPTALPAAII